MSNGHDEDNGLPRKKNYNIFNTPNIFFLIYLNVRPVF